MRSNEIEAKALHEMMLDVGNEHGIFNFLLQKQNLNFISISSHYSYQYCKATPTYVYARLIQRHALSLFFIYIKNKENKV